MISPYRNDARLVIWISLFAFCMMLTLSACQPNTPLSSTTLVVQEYLLNGAPDTFSGDFDPIGTSQKAVLAKHQIERERDVNNRISHLSGSFYPIMESRGPGQSLAAVLDSSSSDSDRIFVQLKQGDEILFSVDAGLPSPALPLQSLWTYQDHWVLEIIYAEGEVWQGRIYRDGVLINEELGYEETFGFQLLAGKPFFFFQGEGGLGYSYNGEEVRLPYDSIPHFGCCSASLLNPVRAENMVAFYAQIGDDWYYVELGDFKQD